MLTGQHQGSVPAVLNDLGADRAEINLGHARAIPTAKKDQGCIAAPHLLGKNGSRFTEMNDCLDFLAIDAAAVQS